MVLSFAFLLIQVLAGFALVDFFDPEKRFTLFEKALIALLTGPLISGFLILVFALASRSLFLGIVVVAALEIILICLRIKHFVKAVSKFSLKSLPTKFLQYIPVIGLAVFLILYWVLLATVLFKAKDNSLRAPLVGWGDIALHLDMIQRFATALPFEISHPLAGGERLTYPFLINFVSAVFHYLGADMVLAFRIPMFYFGTLAILAIFAVALRVLKSKTIALLVLLLVVLGSGLGFFVFFRDLSQQLREGNLVDLPAFFLNLPHEYTHLDDRTGGKPQEKDTSDNIVWMVPIISFLSHQRSFSLGISVFVLIVLAIIVYGQSLYFWRFAVLAGLLPLSHTHSFLSLFFLMAALFWFFKSNLKSWLVFAVIVAIISLPQIIYLRPVSQNFIRPWLWWMTCDHPSFWWRCSFPAGTDSNPLFFWSKNFGLVFLIWLVVLAVSLFPRWRQAFDSRFLVGSLILFAMPNFFLFQPWPFDNNKIFFYWWLVAIIFVVGPVFNFLAKNKWPGKTILSAIMFFGILAGTLDFAGRLLAGENYYYGYSDADKSKIQAGEWIKQNTLPNSLFLTSKWIDPLPLFFAGRKVYLGFPGWLWTEGLDFSKKELTVSQILAGNLDLACLENIDYIVLDGDLEKDFTGINKTFLFQNTQTVFSQPAFSRFILKLNCQN